MAVTRPIKSAGGHTYAEEVALGDPAIQAAEVDADFNTIYAAVNALPTTYPPSGSIASGSLAGSTYPNPVIADGAVTDAKIAGVAYAKVTGAPSALPPSGTASGDLAGSYPAPTIRAGAVDTPKIAPFAVGDGQISSVSWSKVTSAPSTFPPNGAAGGALSGVYPNPGIAAGAVANVNITDVAYAKVTGAPTSLPPSGVVPSGDLQGSYPGPTIKPSALPWTPSGTDLTPTDSTKNIIIPGDPAAYANAVLGASTIKGRLQHQNSPTPGVGLFVNRNWNGNAQDDATKSSWGFYLDPVNDRIVFQRAPAGSTTQTAVGILDANGVTLGVSEGTPRVGSAQVVPNATTQGASSVAIFQLVTFPLGVLRTGRVYRIQAGGAANVAAGTLTLMVGISPSMNQIATALISTVITGIYNLEIRTVLNGTVGLLTSGNITVAGSRPGGPTGQAVTLNFLIYNQDNVPGLPNQTFWIGGQFNTSNASNAMDLRGGAIMEIL